MSMLRIVGPCVFAAAFPVLAFGQEAPGIGQVSIASVTQNGTGCPLGSVATNLSQDNRAMTLIFDQYIADSTELESGLSQKTCDVDLTLNTPAGWSFALFSVQFRGFADVGEGGLVRQNASYGFGDIDPFAVSSMSIAGPFADNYLNVNTVPLANAPFSKCGQPQSTLRLKTEVFAEGRREMQASKVVNCSSSQGRPAECETGAPIVGLAIERQVSAARCQDGRNFGIRGSKIWVNAGCRADFRVAYTTTRPTAPHALVTVDSIDGELQQYGIAWKRCQVIPDPIITECSSGGMRYTECNLGRVLQRADVLIKRSAAACTEGRSYGVRGNVLWVDKGCRAQFKVTPAP